MKYKEATTEGWISDRARRARRSRKYENWCGIQGWMMQAARIRLAADALIVQSEALWLQYESLAG